MGCDCCNNCPGCCSSWATRFDVSNSFTGLANGTCTRCATVNQAWRRSAWRILCTDHFGCTWTSIFEQSANTLSCGAVNQNQGARMDMVCDATNTTITLNLLYHSNPSTPPASMTVAATYQAVVATPVPCDGAIITLNYVSDDGSCTTWPASCTITGSAPTLCP